MTDFALTIDGERVVADAAFDVVNPATGEPAAQAPDASGAHVDAALAAADRAYRDWRGDEGARRAALLAAADAVAGARDELAPILTLEQGKPLAESVREVKGAVAWLRYYAGLELPREVIQDDERAHVEVVRRPIGPVAAITPWNFPLSLAAWKLAPALRAGNTMVLKPSPYTPLTTLKLGELLRDAFPPGVLNVISGRDPLGARLTEHPLTRKISFTGSVGTGKRVAAAAAPDLKRVTLELGGNDPAIVLEDADVAAIAPRIFWTAFANNGQVCSAVKRVYVPEALHDDLVEALAEQARAARVGDGSAEGTQLGPVNNRPQLERVSELVADALAGGATAAAGGAPVDGPGYFYAPTILSGLSDGARIVDEEQFGPALPIVAYRDVDDAIARANGTHFGLGASVWSSDPDAAAAVADRLDAGTAWINAHLVLQPHQPFGGAKWSGIGVENGPWGLYGFTEVQVRYRSKG